MKPRDLLLLRLREHLVEPLGAAGFRFASSGPRFSRTLGHVRQVIEVSSNRFDRDDDVELWTMWTVTSREYARWNEATWGEQPGYDLLGDSADWNIPHWPRGPAARRIQLRNVAEDAAEMAELRDGILGPGQAWLERVSTWEGAAEARLEKRWSFDRAADLFMLAGQPDRARAALLEGIDNFERQGRPDSLGELPRIRARLARYA